MMSSQRPVPLPQWWELYDASLGGGDHVPWPQVGGRSTRESGRGRMTAGSAAAASTSSGGGGGGASNGGRRVAGQQENRRGGRGSRSSARSEKSNYLTFKRV